MYRLLLFLSLFATVAAFPQNESSNVAPMFACSERHPESAGPCATPPKIKSTVPAGYTEEARQAHAEGTVVLRALVKADGTVGDITVVQSLREGLDNNAISSVEKWKFEPAKYQGKPVAVYVDISVTFRLDPNPKAPIKQFDRRAQCEQDLPDLRRALHVSNNGPRPYFDLADCLMDLGKDKEGIGVLESAADFSRSPSVWNNAAYHLASHEVGLDKAVKYAQKAVVSQALEVRNSSRNHLSTDHLVESRTMITFWDTLGWVHFMRGDYGSAAKYLAPGWALWQDPTLGQHLAQTYEKMGRKDAAIRSYAMTIAAEERLNDTNPEMAARLRTELTALAPAGQWEKTLQQGKEDLAKLQTISIPNPASLSGTADFLVGITSTQIKEAKQVSGPAAFKPMAESIRGIAVKIEFPDGADLLFTERGRLQCEPGATSCNFVLLSPLDALALAGK